jgi:hypothetical protein
VSTPAVGHSILSVEHAVQGYGNPARDSEAGSECAYDATAEVVIECSPELGLDLPGTPVNDAGHAYGTEELNRTDVAASVVALADKAVRKCEWARSAVDAA